jgi:hypothetical protein
VASRAIDLVELLLDDIGALDIGPATTPHPLVGMEIGRQIAELQAAERLHRSSHSAQADLFDGRWFNAA